MAKDSRKDCELFAFMYVYLCMHRTEICRDPKIIEKYKWTLKLTPINPAMRTYFVALGSKREMEVS